MISNCHLKVDEKTEVSTQREGVLLYVGREIKDGEEVPLDHRDTYFFNDKEHKYRKLKEGDVVEVNQVLGRIDDRLALDEKDNKENKLLAARADAKTRRRRNSKSRPRPSTTRRA